MKITLRPAAGSALADYLGGEISLDYPEDRAILEDYLGGAAGQAHKIGLPSGRYIRLGHTYIPTYDRPGIGDGLRDSARSGVTRGAYNQYITSLALLDRLVAGERVMVFPTAERGSVGEYLPK